MDLEKFIKDFEEGIEAVEPGSLVAKTRYREHKAWDSLAVLTVTDIIEVKYGVLLNKKDFESTATIEELYECVIRKR